jgi:hypothetical protein
VIQPDKEQIEKVARAMCRAENHEPDNRVFNWVLPIGPRGYKQVPPERCVIAAWEVYWDLAVAAIRAMSDGK